LPIKERLSFAHPVILRGLMPVDAVLSRSEGTHLEKGMGFFGRLRSLRMTPLLVTLRRSRRVSSFLSPWPWAKRRGRVSHCRGFFADAQNDSFSVTLRR